MSTACGGKIPDGIETVRDMVNGGAFAFMKGEHDYEDAIRWLAMVGEVEIVPESPIGYLLWVEVLES